MDFKTYVQSAVAAYVEKQNQNVMFIKHYNTLNISKEEILACVKEKKEQIFLYHEYAMNDMHEAYAPFLDWIRQCYQKYYQSCLSAEDFLKECGVYPIHIEPLANLIRKNRCTRKEDVLYFEIQYETIRMLQNLVRILEYISKQYNPVMILSKFHLAPYSTIQFMKQIIGQTASLHIIVMYNDEFIIGSHKKQVWEELTYEAENQSLQLEWGSMDSQRTIDLQDEFLFDKSRRKEYLVKLNNMYHMFALQDAYYYMNNIMYRLDEKTIWLTKRERLPFLQLAAMIDMNMGNVSHALVICDKMSGLYDEKANYHFAGYKYYYICARARMILGQLDEVKKYCEKCIKSAQAAGNDTMVCKAEMILVSAYMGIGKDIFEYDFSYKADMEIVEKIKKFKFTNFLAYLYVFAFENDKEIMRAVSAGERELYFFRLGIEIGTALENDNFLLNAYMKNIILYSRAGYHNYVRQMYEKRLAVLKRPNPLRESHMLAGLGYNSIVLEDFEKAHKYLLESVYNLTKLEKPDDVMNSLYNLAMNYFVAESYQGAIEVVSLILKMLKELGYQSIGACSTIKLYSIIAISCYYEGEYYNSYYYLSKMKVIEEHMLKILQESHEGVWDEDLLLYHLVKGMMYRYENQCELCQQEFDEVRHYISSASGALFFTLPVFALEQAELYNSQNKYEEAEKVLSEAVDFCTRENMSRKKERLEYFMERKVRKKEPAFLEYEQLPAADMIRMARQAATQNKLLKKEKDIKFLTVLQEAISRENLTVDDLYQNTSAVIKNSYSLDEIVILHKKDGVCSILCGEEKFRGGEDEIEQVFDFFRTYKLAFLTNRVDKNFTQFLPAMQLFEREKIMTMIGIPIIEQSGTENIFLACVNIKRRTVSSRTLLNGEDLMTLKFAFSQFCEMMRRIDNRLVIERMNQRLEQSAITDHLTGIMNRSGFSKHVEEICSQSNPNMNVILYLDLDNFKYYNDTFGHEVGDLVLVCFAEMFKKMTEGKGLAVRYGGDEFIILLYDRSEQDAVCLAKQIYKEIDDGFKEKISIKLNKKIEIPDNKKISCSIGIASFEGGSREEFELALNHADQMLYYVKKHGKSEYKVYLNGKD